MAERGKGRPTKTVGQSSGKKRKSAPSRRKTRFLALEPRVVFDGAMAADLAAQTAPEAAKEAGTATPPAERESAPAARPAETRATAEAPAEGRVESLEP